MRRLVWSLAASCFALSPVAVQAAGHEMSPLLATKGKQLLNEQFSGSDVSAKWPAAKGKWDVKDGMLHGVEQASDNHPAVVRTDIKHSNAVYQFDFKFAEGAKQIGFSVNQAKSHLFRVVITPAGFEIRKDGSKTDPTDKAALIDSCKMSFAPGQSYTMLVEVVGNNVIARVDDHHYAFGSNDALSKEKANFGFPISGEGFIDNVMVWEASANPEWDKAKDKLAAEHAEKLPAGPAAAEGKAGKGAAKGGAKKKAKGAE